MILYYSGSANGFYDDRIHKVMPDDVVEITEECHSTLMEAQAAGKSIRSDTNGSPIAVDRVLTVDQKKNVLLSRVQKHLNATARYLGYDSVGDAIAYADEPAVPAYQAEGKALRTWRSLVWAAALPAIEANPDQPADTLIASLPVFGA